MEAVESVLVEKEKLERLHQKIKDLELALSEKKESVQEKEFPPTPSPLEKQDIEETLENSTPSEPSKEMKKKVKTRPQEVTNPQPQTWVPTKEIKRKIVRKKLKSRTSDVSTSTSPRRQRKITKEEIKRKLQPPGVRVRPAQAKKSRIRQIAKTWLTL